MELLNALLTGSVPHSVVRLPGVEAAIQTHRYVRATRGRALNAAIVVDNETVAGLVLAWMKKQANGPGVMCKTAVCHTPVTVYVKAEAA